VSTARAVSGPQMTCGASAAGAWALHASAVVGSPPPPAGVLPQLQNWRTRRLSEVQGAPTKLAEGRRRTGRGYQRLCQHLRFNLLSVDHPPEGEQFINDMRLKQ